MDDGRGLEPTGEPPTGVDRRAFLRGAAAAGTIATVGFFWLEGVGNPLRRQRIQPTAPDGPRKSLSEAEWNTLEAAQGRLLPSAEGSPGAAEVNAIGYLDAVLADPEIEELRVELIKDGAAQLAVFAREKGKPSFAALPGEVMDEGIRGFEQPEEKQRWLRDLISLTLEAFLGDPVHGGNLDETGWTWTAHRPGFPRPTPGWKPEGRGGR